MLCDLLGDRFVKRKQEYRGFVDLVDSRIAPLEALDSADLSNAVLGERLDRITKQTLVELEDARKALE